ncbi:MAG TPA: type VII secretion protein EssC, partial [Rummeliibacillus sp.]|nr:type VII secretion protein EssC [Rummeliibacillus sp.]
MTIVTVIYSILSYIRNVKKYKKDMKERDVKFNAYLRQKSKELYEVQNEQYNALMYHYPSVPELVELLRKQSARMYEKTPFHNDFLFYRLGEGTVDASYPIKINIEEFTLEEDPLMEKAIQLKNQYNHIDHAPIIVDLVNGAVGYIGKRPLVLQQLKQMIAQLAFFHSYHEVQFIMIFKEHEKKQWEWMRWLPHASLQAINVRSFVYHERSRDQVMNSLYQMLKDRKQQVEKKNSREASVFVPQLVIVITDETIIMDHTIMELLQEDCRKLGVSVIYVQDVLESLPEHISTVIRIKDSTTGELFIQNKELKRQTFELNQDVSDDLLEEVARRLAAYEHLQNLENRIPESITYMEMYGVSTVQELQVASRWQSHKPYKSLAVPLGVRGKDDIVFLNLHEKAHGPHGLVAGTTGSGKSEIIQSYILSLATNFHPYNIGFLLIDYKGGGMANLFKDLPHLLGVITNLDGAQSMRALASIKAELRRRQHIFGENEINHIHQYQKLYEDHKVKDPMPELFIISDEFAELKAEQPEFMKELVSTARIGRSLGIHLILATQKPSGVVDDQIWSNSKFKLALKVQNESDSNEVLKTKDAADITQPGRAYLQVGNNEVYELFQSAWSGATYKGNQMVEDVEDFTIYSINDLGQFEVLTEDLSGLTHKEMPKQQWTQLEAVIEEIHETAVTQQIKALPRPWLPPLEERISRFDLEYQPLETNHLVAQIGMLDLPHEQLQKPFTLDFMRDGHVAIFASPGFGKSTMLQTIAMQIADNYTPEEVHFYLLDFGTNGLLPLQKLPHAADMIRLDEEQKMQKWIKRISSIIKKRKKLLREHGVPNSAMYKELTKEVLPDILIFVDAMDAVSESSFKDEFDELMIKIARDGVGLGIFLVLTASRQLAIRTPILINIKTQITLYMIDQSESRSIMGKSDVATEEMAGRALIKIEEVTLMQVAMPANGEDDLQVSENLRSHIENISRNWNGRIPAAIPMVPESVTDEFFLELPSVQKAYVENRLPFAVDLENVEAVSLDFNTQQHLIVIADSERRFKQVYEAILFTIEHSTIAPQLLIVDQVTAMYSSLQRDNYQYIQQMDETTALIEQLLEAQQARQKSFVEQREGGISSLREFIQQISPIFVIFTDMEAINNQLSSTSKSQLAKVISDGSNYGIHLIFGMNSQITRSYDETSTAMKKLNTAISMVRLNDQSIVEVQRPYREKELSAYEAYLIRGNHTEKIKILSEMKVEVL